MELFTSPILTFGSSEFIFSPFSLFGILLPLSVRLDCFDTLDNLDTDPDKAEIPLMDDGDSVASESISSISSSEGELGELEDMYPALLRVVRLSRDMDP